MRPIEIRVSLFAKLFHLSVNSEVIHQGSLQLKANGHHGLKNLGVQLNSRLDVKYFPLEEEIENLIILLNFQYYVSLSMELKWDLENIPGVNFEHIEL
jgi:hypothetical protein